MALTTLLESATPTTLLITLLLSYLAHLLQRAYLTPLRQIPGPWICRLTSLWIHYHSYLGDECSQITRLHAQYGPVLRIAPTEVCIADGAALAPIYTDKGGFLKADCYANFDIEGHATIFSTRDPGYRSARSKAVVGMFSMGSVRGGTEVLEGCVGRFVARLREERKGGRVCDVLNLSRGLALDAVSSYLFGRPFGGVEERGERMSASSFVDALVAVGRFFFLPNWLFLAIDMAKQRVWPDKEEMKSTERVDSFVRGVIEDEKQEATYQERLRKAGISQHEVEVQCKDLIFAGTDSTGQNLSTICWQLAKHPEIYEKLRAEITAADKQDPPPQTLPYLDAVLREGLRIAMANPTRLPRVVPPQGFTFTTHHHQQNATSKTYHLPAGTLVGCQIHTLHFNPAVFTDPFAFKPERWFHDPSPEMLRDWIPFGQGARQCIARNLAMRELWLAISAVAREGVLEGAEAVGEGVEIMEWFNSKVVGERIELTWP